MIELKHVSKTFDSGTAGGVDALKDVSLTIEDRDIYGIIGMSGAGKSTLVRCINLLERPTSGEIVVNGQRLDTMTPAQLRAARREITMIFQRFNLLMQRTCLRNVCFPMELAGVKKAEAEQRARELLELVGLPDKADSYPAQLSGGQQQRVAIARALVNRPEVLLLDEPLGALDLRLRKDMQNELKRIQQQLGITFIYVTHDQEEALAMSDTVVVMDRGRIQQIGTPEDIYNEPKNAFVADFIGESNILDGIMRADYVVEFFGRKFRCLDKGFAPDEPVDVVIRPEDVDIVPPDSGHLCGTVTSVTFKGVHYDTIVDFKGFKWLIQTTDLHRPGEYIGIRLTPDDIHVMKKSEYSGMFGDYSSYSAEYDEINDPDAVIGGEDVPPEEALHEN